MRITFQNSNTGFTRTVERPTTFNGRLDLNNAFRRGLGFPERTRQDAWNDMRRSQRVAHNAR